jgi:hypothetical protein
MKRSLAVTTAMMVAGLVALAWTTHASADGAANFSTCQTLSSPNTTYRLTTDLTSCETCLVVGAERITIDLQGHSITSTCGPTNDGIVNSGAQDLIVIKNGSIIGFSMGIHLSGGRHSVLGVIVRDNNDIGINLPGPRNLVKSCEAAGNFIGVLVGDRGQVQQCNVHDNRDTGIIAVGDYCLVTMNTANKNGAAIATVTEDRPGALGRCTVSFNTVNNSLRFGIRVDPFEDGSGHLVTRNVVLNTQNGGPDYTITCPSDVTFNTSTNGFPTSYELSGKGCKTVGND